MRELSNFCSCYENIYLKFNFYTLELDNQLKLNSNKSHKRLKTSPRRLKKKSTGQKRDKICEFCSQSYFCKFSLKAHTLMQHKNTTQCDQCPVKLSSHETFRSHLMSHDKDKCHICEICGQSALQYFKYLEHMRTHTGERPFKASYINVYT